MKVNALQRMTPYYTDELITIYCADCREVATMFDDNHFALAIADPPYGIGETRKVSRGRHDGFAFRGGAKPHESPALAQTSRHRCDGTDRTTMQRSGQPIRSTSFVALRDSR